MYKEKEIYICHLGKGIQYCCYDYIDLLKDNDTEISMSAKSNTYDNAFIESFFKILKAEEVYLWEYETYNDMIKRILYSIDDVYNIKRLHSSLGYLPPKEFEDKNKSCKVYSELR